jgi:hypothetical protein
VVESKSFQTVQINQVNAFHTLSAGAGYILNGQVILVQIKKTEKILFVNFYNFGLVNCSRI